MEQMISKYRVRNFGPEEIARQFSVKMLVSEIRSLDIISKEAGVSKSVYVRQLIIDDLKKKNVEV